MRRTLQFEVAERGPSFTDALRILAEEAERLGVLVMVNGWLGATLTYKLDPWSSGGSPWSIPLAPLVFVKGADTKAAQIFTLAHELAHLWLGETGAADCRSHDRSHRLISSGGAIG